MKASLNKSSSRVSVTLLLAATLVVAAGCKKDEPPPPLPAPKAAEAPKPQPLKIDEMDAGKPEEVKKPTGTGKPAASFAACCAALRQNAASAPPPTGDYMLQAAAMCDAMAKQGQNKATIMPAILGALRGASLPSGCR